MSAPRLGGLRNVHAGAAPEASVHNVPKKQPRLALRDVRPRSSPPRLHVAAPVERLNGGAPPSDPKGGRGGHVRRHPEHHGNASAGSPHSLVSGRTVILDRVATLIDIGRAPPYFGLSAPTSRHVPRAGFLFN